MYFSTVCYRKCSVNKSYQEKQFVHYSCLSPPIQEDFGLLTILNLHGIHKVTIQEEIFKHLGEFG